MGPTGSRNSTRSHKARRARIDAWKVLREKGAAREAHLLAFAGPEQLPTLPVDLGGLLDVPQRAGVGLGRGPVGGHADPRLLHPGVERVLAVGLPTLDGCIEASSPLFGELQPTGTAYGPR